MRDDQTYRTTPYMTQRFDGGADMRGGNNDD